jgi:hypothetical protein
VLLGDQQARPARLDGGRPEVGQRAAVERLAARLDVLTRESAPRAASLQELLLVGQREVHDATAASRRALPRSSANGIALVQARLRAAAEHPLADHRAQDLLRAARGLQARAGRDQLAPASSSSAVGPEHVDEQLAAPRSRR